MSRLSDNLSSPSSRCHGFSSGDEEQDFWSDYSADFESSVALSPPKQRGRSRKSSTVSFAERKRLGRQKYAKYHRRRLPRKKQFCPKSGEQNLIISQILSAKQRRIDQAEDELFNVRQEFESIRKENRILKTLQQKQEKVIRKFDDRKSELPRLISQHAEEQKCLKVRLKRARTAERNLEVKLHGNNKSLLRMENALKYLKKMVDDKDLKDRSELTNELAQKERSLATAEMKIEKLDRHIELNASSFMRQINAEKRKHKETIKKLIETEKEFETAISLLKEKERALNVANIYAFRKKNTRKTRKATALSNATPDLISTQSCAVDPLCLESKPTANKCDGDEYQATAENSIGENLPSTVDETRPQGLTLRPVQDRQKERVVFPKKRNFQMSRNGSSKTDSELQDNAFQPELSSSRQSQITASPENTTSTSTKPQSISKSSNENLSSIFVTAKFETGVSSSDFPSKLKFPSRGDDTSLLNEFCSNSSDLREGSKVAKSMVTKTSQARGPKVPLNQDVKDESLERTTEARVAAYSKQDHGSSTVGDRKPLWREPDKYEIEKTPRKSYQFSKEIQNLHLGIPSSIEDCKRRLENLDKEVVCFGSYSPTVRGTPTRRKYLPMREYKSVSRPENSNRKNFKKNDGIQLKGTRESDLLMRLFGNLELEKQKLLGDDDVFEEEEKTLDEFARIGRTQAPEVSARASPAESPRKKDTNPSILLGDGDCLDVRVKPFCDENNSLILEDDIIEDRPA